MDKNKKKEKWKRRRKSKEGDQVRQSKRLRHTSIDRQDEADTHYTSTIDRHVHFAPVSRMNVGMTSRLAASSSRSHGSEWKTLLSRRRGAIMMLMLPILVG